MVQGAKTVVLGLGGSGLEVLQRMPSGANAELIALSTDEDAIWSLDDEIKRVLIRDPSALCGDIIDARKLLPSVFDELESALSGAEMAVITGFAGKSDARMGGLVAGLCASKGVFTIIMQSGCPADAESGATARAVLLGLKDKADGIIAACSPAGNSPEIAAQVICLLSASLSGSGYICANKEELRGFFRGRLFRLAAGSGSDHGEAMHGALVASGNCAEGIRGEGSALVLASGPAELSIPEMRDATGAISATTGADGVKWAGAQSESGSAGIALILPIADMPTPQDEANAVDKPREGVANEAGDGWGEVKSANSYADAIGESAGGEGGASEAAEQDNGASSLEEGSANPFTDEIMDLIPKIETGGVTGCRYTGLEPVEEILSVKEATPADAQMLPISGLLADDENDAPSAAAAAELERTAAAELDIPEIGGGEEETYVGSRAEAEEDTREAARSIAESLRFRSPALIGMHVDANRALEREIAMKRAYEKGIISKAPSESARPERRRDDTDDAVSELSGYPSYSHAKPSQKKLGEYGFFKKFR